MIKELEKELIKNIQNSFIEKIEIKNFKSIVNMNLELGMFNIFIGANGSGKSNILEAIAFGNAGLAGELDKLHLEERGIRTTSPALMVNAFNQDNNIPHFSSVYEPELEYTVKPKNKNNENNYGNITVSFKLSEFKSPNKVNIFYSNEQKRWIDKEEDFLSLFLNKVLDEASISNDKPALTIQIKENPNKKIELDTKEVKVLQDSLRLQVIKRHNSPNFKIYSPSENIIRNVFEYSNPPFGCHGEGLLRYLKELNEDKSGIKTLEKVNEGLMDLDWFDSLKVPENLFNNEFSLEIKDRFIQDGIKYIDQNSVNEGFLFLLFYLTLFYSKATSNFFAIDNLEASFNPALCKKICRDLIGLSLKNKKQVLVTTHNPYVLDGMDLQNEKLRLFVVSRNLDGHTIISRVKYNKKRTLPLSQLWMSGLIGGLPDNF